MREGERGKGKRELEKDEKKRGEEGEMIEGSGEEREGRGRDLIFSGGKDEGGRGGTN